MVQSDLGNNALFSAQGIFMQALTIIGFWAPQTLGSNMFYK
ncbi:Uncharacterised protein [Grimontia hollisae]|uniref:Uncharacterized protein n=1 Tax=Grimontia hollisae TaxID=673 RepID=A0A377J984_GRIHO|nr:Uncharacterised protein [Grimontia hollisae]STO98356.1 Uncharacterised protein [Grimontia hollisae]